MKKLLLSFFLLMAASLHSKDYKVSTALDFIKALGPNRTVIVQGIINLSDVLENNDLCKELGMEAYDYDIDAKSTLVRSEEYDGHMLIINKVKNLTIKGEDGAAILVSPRYAYPLSFRMCKEIKLVNFTAGHTDEGYCNGGVLEFKQCQDIEIDRCDLFGCGIEGITAVGTTNLVCKKSIIRDCSYSIMELRKCLNMTFEDCDFYRCREYTLIAASDCTNTNFIRCRMSQNQGTLFGLNNSVITLSDCEIHHVGPIGNINIKNYPTTRFFNDEDVLEGRGFGPTGRPNLRVSREDDDTEECGEEEEETEDDFYAVWNPESVEENHRKVFGNTLEDHWAGTPITLPQSEGTPNIFNLTLAFCKQWTGNDDDPRRVFFEFATGKRHMQIDKDETSNISGTKSYYGDGCSINYNTKEGWLESDNNEDEKNLKAAIWNRNDRHKLLVLVLEQPVLEMSAMCYCYDYDPETRKLRPLPDMKEFIEMKHYGYIMLPKKGKDITLTILAADGDVIFKWNGYSFNVKRGK
ncbi:right-handed parallel beta-helix repeat-containing protein [Alloprevotella tannerae]|uniref:right-handed parallel beta-helix repeat-containing protein n=1 Tax=Alloprevotella tannerae TaxID=76122 RepID=UPI0025F13E64|nr:right-handed parallel beta-helix repeat-containing protein [Alloprevotella tannerae]